MKDDDYLTGPWTIVEDDKLRRLVADGKSVEDIARTIKRTPSAIKKRASKLKLTLRRTIP